MRAEYIDPNMIVESFKGYEEVRIVLYPTRADYDEKVERGLDFGYAGTVVARYVRRDSLIAPGFFRMRVRTLTDLAEIACAMHYTGLMVIDLSSDKHEDGREYGIIEIVPREER